jgi:predicted PurR-regulated permease PerM
VEFCWAAHQAGSGNLQQLAIPLHPTGMEVRSHVRITARSLKRWFIAECLNSLCVALLWLAGLLILRVPWAPLWALLAAGFHFIPTIGGVLTLLGPLSATLIDGHGWEGSAYLLGLYAVVMVVDGLVLQPMLTRRVAKVPIWASIAVPLVLGFFFNFWGVLLSAPLLAVVYGFRAHRKEMRQLPPVQIIPPDIGSHRRDEPPTIIEG